MVDEDVAYGPLPAYAGPRMRSFSISIYVISASVSLLAFVYGLAVVYMRPHVWRSSIFRVILMAQIINCMRFVIRPIVVFVRIRSDFGCRVLLFLNNVTGVLPVNLTIYAVVYLQLVVIHKVSPTKRWPRVLLISLGVGLSILPTLPFIILPPSVFGKTSYCLLGKNWENKEYLYIVFTVIVWQYLPGIVGIISVSTVAIYIIRTRRRTKTVMRASSQYYGMSMAASVHGKQHMLSQSMWNIIWFPITPIVSLWLNLILISIHHYKQRPYMVLEYLNVVLLGLQSILLAIALFVNPSVRHVLSDRLREKNERRGVAASEHGPCGRPECEQPECDRSAMHRADSLSILSLKDSSSFSDI
ncbi:hypothetical protein BX661DRAFT_180967 [Kickxella alabastrina]|uniref:uncharacterized protein n=1 Tax=Kickxella alabastrina TaxID=61397 RepID=UPI00222118EB|nr:uncharacterized protein BX661DRAFT_180967 [Kickxella alabastrina]KAI7830033.1 hypothetical protein BX661DRAFT_180967 [Kickxella alabastrina]